MTETGRPHQTLKQKVERLKEEFSREKGRVSSRNRSRPQQDGYGTEGYGTPGGYTTNSSVGPTSFYSSSSSRNTPRRSTPARASTPRRSAPTQTPTTQRKHHSDNDTRRPPFLPSGKPKRATSTTRRREPIFRSAGYAAPTTRGLVTRLDKVEGDMRDMKKWRTSVEITLQKRLHKQQQLTDRVLDLSHEAEVLSCEQQELKAQLETLVQLRNAIPKKRKTKHSTVRKPSPVSESTATYLHNDDDDYGCGSHRSEYDDSFESSDDSLSRLLSGEDSNIHDLKKVYAWMK